MTKCYFCFYPFTQRTSTQKFCSPECKKGDRNQRHRLVNSPEMRWCIICSEVYYDSHGRRKTCGKEACQKARKRVTKRHSEREYEYKASKKIREAEWRGRNREKVKEYARKTRLKQRQIINLAREMFPSLKEL